MFRDTLNPHAGTQFVGMKRARPAPDFSSRLRHDDHDDADDAMQCGRRVRHFFNSVLFS
jgi:hypothetical protein